MPQQQQHKRLDRHRRVKRYVAREIYDQLLHPRPAPDAGTLRTVRTAKQLTLQQAADALHVWPTTLSRLERGLSHDNNFHKRYETWLNCQSPATVQMPDPGLARVLPA
jgi:transposase